MQRGVINITLTGLMAALTCIGGWIRFDLPFTPVPITLQTFFVYLAGLLLGWKLGALSLFVYLLIGLTGVPVFAGFTAGFGVIFGPTGGFLIGFILGAGVIGWLSSNMPGRRLARDILAVLSGMIVIFFLGSLWMSVILHISFTASLINGVLPFLFGDFIKATAAILVGGKLRRILEV